MTQELSNNLTIGIITSAPEVMQTYFPTNSEPDFAQTNPYFTPDDQLAVNELTRAGVVIKPIVWGAQNDLLNDIDLLIVRSCWDYMSPDNNRILFMKWLDQLEVNQRVVLNPIPLLKWLLNKTYLNDINLLGISTIPTQYINAGTRLDLLATLKIHPEYILKPCVSAGGIGLIYINDETTARQQQATIDEALATTDYMLQPLIQEIRTKGEWSLVFIQGQYSHCILKKPAPDSILVHAERGGQLDFQQEAPAAIVDFAHAAYQAILPAFNKATGHTLDPSTLLYMRLDIIDTANGPVLIECEGVEPELFFRKDLSSLSRFKNAIFKHMEPRRIELPTSALRTQRSPS